MSTKERHTFLVRLISHEGFWIISLCTLLIPQVASSVQVFAHNNTQYENPWFAWCYAIGIDLAVLIFSVRGKMAFALMYLIVMIIQALIGQLLPPNNIYGIVLVHTALPVTIFTFTHLFYYQKKEAQKHKVSTTEPQVSAEVAQLTAMVAQGIRLEAQPYLCPQCGVGAKSSKKLNGHISGHKMKNDWFPEKYGDWETENEVRAALLTQIESNVEFKTKQNENKDT